MTAADAATEQIRERLEAIAEELADLAMERLRDAIGDADGGSSRSATEERRLTRARHAVEKATALLTVGDDDR